MMAPGITRGRRSGVLPGRLKVPGASRIGLSLTALSTSESTSIFLSLSDPGVYKRPPAAF